MTKNYYDITLALAGIHQAARLVQNLAHQGECDNTALVTLLNTLVKIDAPSTLAIFGEEAGLHLGLESLINQFNASQPKIKQEIIRYIGGIMLLERKLSANNAALNTMSQRLDRLQHQLSHFDIDSETILLATAEIYLDVITPLGPRIQVTGSANALQRPLVQAKIRATLLAGIRVAVLWRQIGGNRWQLLLSHGRFVREAKNILTRC